MKKIHYKQALKEIAAIVADSPEHVYTLPASMPNPQSLSCLYAHDTGPGCIIGQWLSLFHGMSLDELRALDGKGSIQALSSDEGLLGEISFTPRALQFLRAMQYWQDAQHTWSKAFWIAVNQPSGALIRRPKAA